MMLVEQTACQGTDPPQQEMNGLRSEALQFKALQITSASSKSNVMPFLDSFSNAEIKRNHIFDFGEFCDKILMGFLLTSKVLLLIQDDFFIDFRPFFWGGGGGAFGMCLC